MKSCANKISLKSLLHIHCNYNESPIPQSDIPSKPTRGGNGYEDEWPDLIRRRTAREDGSNGRCPDETFALFQLGTILYTGARTLVVRRISLEETSIEVKSHGPFPSPSLNASIS